MSTTPTPVPAVTPHWLDTILNDLLVGTQVLGAVAPLFPGIGTAVAGGALIASKLEAIVLGAYNAHKAIMGKPMDLSLLKDEEPV